MGSIACTDGPDDHGESAGGNHVIVIGAGIIGVSIAYHLARRGAQVTVLDKQTPGSACTQGAFAMLLATHTDGTEELNQLYGLAVAEWRQLEARLGERLPIQWGGVVNWVEPGNKVEEIVSTRKLLKEWNVKVEALSEDDIRFLVPGAVPGPVGDGNFLPGYGALDVMQTFAVMVQQAKRLGVNFRTPVEVTNMTVSNTGRPHLGTSEGPMESDKVVVAAGAGSSHLAQTLGVRIPLKMVSGTLAYSKPMQPVLHRVLNGPRGSIRQNPDGRIVTGLDYRPGADGHNVSDAYGEMLLKNAAEVVPALAGMELDEMTLGHVPISEDSSPIVGFCEPSKAVYVATTMSGVTMAPLIGRLAAAEVLGERTSILDSFRPSRFN
ncbi:FAD dependent oxidoreductase [Exophiala viscosa]|uniref:FAD dependent oxidoreductase n=1 Tax=Exophiala viscosa TaxID=2486360 RepID=A0AAN6DPE7_9EURO|nr:FAD dependent oxidoreductase [Exophiala viscosa]